MPLIATLLEHMRAQKIIVPAFSTVENLAWEILARTVGSWINSPLPPTPTAGPKVLERSRSISGSPPRESAGSPGVWNYLLSARKSDGTGDHRAIGTVSQFHRNRIMEPPEQEPLSRVLILIHGKR